jgi:hypothetical protein
MPGTVSGKRSAAGFTVEFMMGSFVMIFEDADPRAGES